MPRASKRQLSKDIIVEIDNEFVNLISSLRTSQEIQEFLNNFLTKEEKTMLSKRLMLHLMLEKRYRTNNIENILKISRDTVSKHKGSWIVGGITYKKVLRKLIGKANTRKIIKKIDSKLNYLDLAIKSRSNMQARAKMYSGDVFKKVKKTIL